MAVLWKEALTSKAAVAKTSRAEKRGSEAEMWHSRLGYVTSVSSANLHLKQGLMPHFMWSKSDLGTCGKGKFRSRFSGYLTKAASVGRQNVDAKGKNDTESADGHQDLLKIVEGYSRYGTVWPIRTKGEAYDIFFDS